ncbi:MAG: O-antigen ligase family protein, partial [Candidatus Omnitrophica bacterium]|nr:O-antigen ligase family protein [Candidatus Omnitrophota bacterium]
AYKQRMETMHNSVENIDSAVSRMNFWETAIVMANANPYFGVGLQRYKSEYNRYDRSKGDFGVERALHSTILQTMAEMGYPGFLLYILIIICYFLGIGTSKRRIRMYLNEGQEKKEFLAYLNALTIAMIAFLINSSFVNCLYFETLWAFIGVIIAAESITGKFCQQETVLQTGANG